MSKPELSVKVNFSIKSEALIYDIENTSFVVGNVISDDEQPMKHQLIDVAQEGNIDILLRALDLAYSECQNFLFPYVKTTASDVDLGDNMLEDEDEGKVREFAFELQVPSSFSHTTAIYVKKLVHEYMKCRALAEWMSLAYPQAQPSWEIKAEDAKSKLREVLNFRCGKVRRKMHPFS